MKENNWIEKHYIFDDIREKPEELREKLRDETLIGQWTHLIYYVCRIKYDFWHSLCGMLRIKEPDYPDYIIESKGLEDERN